MNNSTVYKTSIPLSQNKEEKQNNTNKQKNPVSDSFSESFASWWKEFCHLIIIFTLEYDLANTLLQLQQRNEQVIFQLMH